ncbi:hypothetical protein Agub_g1193, partial [Astrephomene gubernaculifera]
IVSKRKSSRELPRDRSHQDPCPHPSLLLPYSLHYLTGLTLTMADSGSYVPDDLAVSRLQMMAHCDEAQARFLLEASGGNLELALQMAIENSALGGAYAEPSLGHRPDPTRGGPFPGAAPSLPSHNAPHATTAAATGGAVVPPRPRAPMARAPAPPAGAAVAVAAAPLSLITFVLRIPLYALGLGFRLMRYTAVNGVHAAAIVGDRVLPVSVMRAARSAAAAAVAAVGGGGGPGGVDLDPAGQAALFVATFKSLYGDRHPRWQECGWRVACQQARREFKFLFVYLHSPEHEDTDAFCRTVLTHPDVVDYVNLHCVSWGGDVTASDAFVLSQQVQMGVTRFPYVALLSSAPGDGGRLQLLAAASGPDVSAPGLLLLRLRATVEAHGVLLAAQRAEVEEREFARRLLEEQDAEYEASLAADRKREAERAEERKRQEEEEQRQREEERLAQEAAAAEAARVAEAAAAVERRRQAARAALLPEPPAGAEGSAAIRLRLPDGSHTSRSFPQGATLNAVFDYVESLDASSYPRFHLVSSYPRRVFLRAAHGPAQLQELGLVPQAALFVQPDE